MQIQSVTEEINGGDDSVKTSKVRHKGHRLTVTCVCVDSRNEFAFTGSKDGSIIKWTIQEPRIVNKINSLKEKNAELVSTDSRSRYHIRHINCLAISSDDKFLASGGWDKLIRIWSPADLTWLHTFTMHRQEVTCLAFRIDHPTLYSGSTDRSVMLWTLEDDDNRCFVEALYGHEATITSIDTLRKERVVTSGGLDRSVRVWKIVEQAQTVFETKHDSVDIVRFIDDKTFVSGGTDGSITLWTTMKRSPLFTLKEAHQTNVKFTERHRMSIDTGYDQKGFSFWLSALAVYSSAIATPRGKKRKKSKLKSRGENDFESGEEQSSEDEEEELEVSESSTVLVASGSCNSEIKIWKLHRSQGKYELKIDRTLECHGFINDLRFTSDGKKLIAACGQEHKFGRWWKLKAAKNCLRIFDLNK